MRIIRLEVSNVKRLKAIEIKPDGNLVVIGGLNDQGKTSTLDSIAMAFGGKKYIPSKPVRKGAKKAKIVAETEDLIITRTMTAEGGGTLKVGTKDGKLYQSPQAILDALTGQLTFDPLLFSRMKPGEQLDTLKELVGLDFTDLEDKRNGLYNDRAEVNKDGKRVVALLESMTVFVDAPEEEILVSALMEELDRRVQQNEGVTERKETLEDNQIITAEQKEQITELTSDIEKLESELAQVQQDKDKLIESVKRRMNDEAREHDAITTLPVANVQEIKDKISTAEEVNQQVRSNQKRTETEHEVSQIREKSRKLTDAIEQIDLEKEKQLSEAKFPIDGLTFDEDGVLFNEMPWNQLSSWDQLNISAAMGFSVNPKLKVLLIREGSLIDNDNLKRLAKTIPEDGQIWLERVGEGEEVSVIIEDGSIKQDA